MKKKLIYLLLVIGGLGCKDSYELPLDVPETGYLVVDGTINSAQGATIINLSRTAKIADLFNVNYVNDASVLVEGEDNSSVQLGLIGNGRYEASQLNLNPNTRYRLHIFHGNREYQTDYLKVQQSPAIDSISWDRDATGLNIYADAKGNANTSGYYRWDFQEDWEFHSAYAPNLRYNTIPMAEYIFRNGSSDMSKFICYQSAPSTNLEILSTARISKDTTHYRLTTIPSASWKISVLYSINVRQHALSRQGYEYLFKMRKNTEQTGSLFDSQPSELRGNITCVTNPAEPVIGFMEVAEIYSKRIFIKSSEVPSWGFRHPCTLQSLINHPDSIQAFGSPPPVIPETLSPMNDILTFYYAPLNCIDCTTQGTLTKPSFWP